jgi:hypothetical protein
MIDMYNLLGKLLLLLLIPSGFTVKALAREQLSPENLSCEVKDQFDKEKYQKMLLMKNADDTYTLRYQSILRYALRLVEVDVILANNLSCHFVGPTDQTLKCESTEDAEFNPSIRGPSGPIKHLLDVQRTSSEFINNDGIKQIESTTIMRYSRTQQIWVSKIKIHGRRVDVPDRFIDFNIDGLIETEIPDDCFTFSGIINN